MIILGVISTIFTALLFLTNFKRLQINKLSHVIMMVALIITFVFCINATYTMFR